MLETIVEFWQFYFYCFQNDELSLLPKWGAIYYLKSLWDLKSEITSLHFTDFILVKAISL